MRIYNKGILQGGKALLASSRKAWSPATWWILPSLFYLCSSQWSSGESCIFQLWLYVICLSSLPNAKVAKQVDLSSGTFGQEELGCVCTVGGSTVLLPWLSCCQGNKPFKTRQVASTSSLVLKALLLGFEEWCLVKGSLPFLSKLLTWKIFGAVRCRLNGLSPRTVNVVDEACDLCTWFDVVLVCHPLSGLG